MKNAQYYNIKRMDICGIAQKYVHKDCSGIPCDICLLDTVEWLNKEKDVDWNSVLPFTPVKVRDNDEETWCDDYYFVRMIIVESKECFIVSTTDNVEDPGNELVVYNQCIPE